MAENWSNNQTTQATEARAQAVDEGLRIYMTKVYNYMGLGLLATALTAYIGAASGIYVALAQTLMNLAGRLRAAGHGALFISAPASHERARGENNVLDLRRHDRAFPVLCIARLYRRFRGPHFPDYRRVFRRFVALRLHHQARFERHGLVPVYGAYRHYFGVYRQFLHAKPGHAFRHFGDRCADFCRTDGL